MTVPLPRLDRALLRSGRLAGRAGLHLPDDSLLDRPERAVQFGTGAFLRGFVESILDDANRRGTFRGRIVAVSSTGSGREMRWNEQDGLYTLVMHGGGRGPGAAAQETRDTRVIASVSRALSAGEQWDEVLACARAPELTLVFSNTTEVGIALDERDTAEAAPPRSFPGKLTCFLFERARTFQFARDRGVVVLPCELIERNGDRLREIVLALAHRWRLPGAFAQWIREAVPFCNTLVDRIVPGTPAPDERRRRWEALGCRDEMLTTCESYRLFAIEGDAALRARLGFAEGDPSVIVRPDIVPFRERKVRLLNGTHSIMAPVALLCGCETVGDAMRDRLIAAFVHRALFQEMVPSAPVPDAEAFARDVLERFANPFIRHELAGITLQGTTKLRVRVVPSILGYAERTGEVPAALAFGLAAYLLFMRGTLHEQYRAAGRPLPADDEAGRVRARWDAQADEGGAALHALARDACADDTLWGADLTRIPGFADAVAEHLVRAHRDGMRAALAALLRPAPAPRA
ncbi:MAG TPA: tagaturonate reductase [Gemmatimonadaceae bacterium]|nr:tagaturonate reductase [Gemmatimonadaceae bacterium]